MADQNFEKLKDESDRLEQHAKKSVNWLLWIMLIVVCFIFISMILFIRIFPKLKWLLVFYLKLPEVQLESSVAVITVSNQCLCHLPCPQRGCAWPTLASLSYSITGFGEEFCGEGFLHLGTWFFFVTLWILLPLQGRTGIKMAIYAELLLSSLVDPYSSAFNVAVANGTAPKRHLLGQI